MKKSLIFLITFLLLLTMFALTSCGDEEKIEKFNFKLNENGNEYNVEIGFTAITEDENLVIPDTYNDLPVTAIVYQLSSSPNEKYKYSSADKDHVISLTIPDSIKTIDSQAFVGCKNLKEVIIGENSNLTNPGSFKNCSSLESITLPEGVKTLPNISGCSSLESINVPTSVTYIGKDLFNDCPKLSAVHIKDLSKWCEIIFGNGDAVTNPLNVAKNLYLNGELVRNLVIPEGVTKISAFSFYGAAIESLTIPESVTEIGRAAFYNCSGITELSIPSSVTKIDAFAFAMCTGFTNIVVPSNVEILGNYVFLGCENLQSITIPFVGSRKLTEDINSTATGVKFSSIFGTSDDIPASLKTVTVTGNLIPSYSFASCRTIENIILSETVSYIGSHAFYTCSGLKEITIPGSIEKIGYSAFESCTNLKNVTIQDGVLEIASSAFEGCSSLTNITLANTITKIGSHAFDSCRSLEKIVIPISVVEIEYMAFVKVDKLTIYAEAKSNPSGWETPQYVAPGITSGHSWNYDDRPVVWDYNE